MNDLTLCQLVELAGLTHAHARHLSGLSERQYRRHRNSAAPVPTWLARLLLACSGDLGVVATPWSGWRLSGDTLVSPEGQCYGLAWFARLSAHFGSLAEERRQLRRRVAQLERLLPTVPPVPPGNEKPRTVPGLVVPLQVISGGASSRRPSSSS